MAIRFTCPAGHRLKVPDEKAGRGMLCPVCQTAVTVPVADSTPPEPPPVRESGGLSSEEPAGQDAVSAAATSGTVEPLPAPSDIPPVGRQATVTRSHLDSRPWGLAAGLLVVLVYSALPVLGHLGDVPMPMWVRVLAGAFLLQVVFLVWMLTVRHWAAMAIVTILFGLASIGYATIAVLAFAMRDKGAIPWELEPIQFRAAIWSATVLAVYSLATYLSGVATVRRRNEMTDEPSAER